MYPFYVDGTRVFSFSYKPSVNDVIRDDDTENWYIVETVPVGRDRTVYGRKTTNPTI